MTDERRREEMVDRRVCLILAALMHPDESTMEAEALIEDYLADEWACLEVAARVIAPAFGLDAMDDAAIVRLQRAAHGAIKAECRRIVAGKIHVGGMAGSGQVRPPERPKGAK